jgi:hypothetical protein
VKPSMVLEQASAQLSPWSCMVRMLHKTTLVKKSDFWSISYNTVQQGFCHRRSFTWSLCSFYADCSYCNRFFFAIQTFSVTWKFRLFRIYFVMETGRCLPLAAPLLCKILHIIVCMPLFMTCPYSFHFVTHLTCWL